MHVYRSINTRPRVVTIFSWMYNIIMCNIIYIYSFFATDLIENHVDGSLRPQPFDSWVQFGLMRQQSVFSTFVSSTGTSLEALNGNPCSRQL